MMLKNQNIALLFICGLFILSSCAPRVPFTQTIRDENKLSDKELKKLQFYVSHDIILTKGEKKQDGQDIDDGTLVLTSGSSMDQVVIKAGTPGVVEKVIDNNKIAVSFEAPGKYLVFGDPQGKNGRYTLLAADWKKNRGVTNYGGNSFVLNSGAANTYIRFKMRKLNKLKRSVRYAKGRKI
ncbi:MAG: hypothetical protein MRY83_21835 [Flavobacteriales bacterium]|nr:hypothetical protein [Flavobacteriales bacterium]